MFESEYEGLFGVEGGWIGDTQERSRDAGTLAGRIVARLTAQIASHGNQEWGSGSTDALLAQAAYAEGYAGELRHVSQHDIRPEPVPRYTMVRRLSEVNRRLFRALEAVCDLGQPETEAEADARQVAEAGAERDERATDILRWWREKHVIR